MDCKGDHVLSRERIDTIVRHYGRDILKHEHMEIERRSLQHGDVTTYGHSLRVAALSVWIADRLRLWNCVDLRALVRAALLHDYFLYDWHDDDGGSHRLHGFRHPYTAEANARADFELDDVVLNSIRTHMFPLTPVPPRYLEGVIVNVADTVSAVQETIASRLRRVRRTRAARKHEQVGERCRR
ncbi:HD domain-containing protein [Bifidobacterium anseris]|uniref:HD domain-containing protein n=1 Tax=Bifidobacterium anseris TaxID=2020963 RepID=UPI000C77FCE1